MKEASKPDTRVPYGTSVVISSTNGDLFLLSYGDRLLLALMVMHPCTHIIRHLYALSSSPSLNSRDVTMNMVSEPSKKSATHSVSQSIGTMTSLAIRKVHGVEYPSFGLFMYRWLKSNIKIRHFIFTASCSLSMKDYCLQLLDVRLIGPDKLFMLTLLAASIKLLNTSEKMIETQSPGDNLAFALLSIKIIKFISAEN